MNVESEKNPHGKVIEHIIVKEPYFATILHVELVSKNDALPNEPYPPDIHAPGLFLCGSELSLGHQ